MSLLKLFLKKYSQFSIINEKIKHESLRLCALSKLRNSNSRDFSLSSSTHLAGETSASLENPLKVNDLLTKWTKIFEDNEISEARESIEFILEHILNTRQLKTLLGKELSAEQIEKIEKLCGERLKKTPIQYVLGEWDFRSQTLKMRPPVFIPRPETEGLVDLILEEIDETTRHQNILELCCGSGAISLSILHERHPIKAIAVDQSAEACILTKENAQKLKLDNRLTIVQASIENWNYAKLGQQFNIIVSNPPYIPTNELDQLQPEILLFEDLQALDGGPDNGLTLIKRILSISNELLNKNGKLFLELDPRQPLLLHNYLENNQNSLQLILSHTLQDFCNKNRYCIITKK